MKYQRIVAEVFHKPWAILPEKFDAIVNIIRLRASGERLGEEEIRARLASHAASRGAAASFGAVAVIPVFGVISQRMNLMSQVSGGTSIEKLTSQFRAALADPGIKAIVFDVDSPGGSVEGVPEITAEIIKGRTQKKIVAVANSLAASAAYWIASAASELVMTPSAQVGSIGVFAAHEDLSQALEKEGVKVSLVSAGKFKTEGNPYEPLSEEGRVALQTKVDAFYEMFIKDVARGRGVSQSAVRGGFGQGRMLMGSDAMKEGMVDRVATLDETLARLGGSAPPQRVAAEAGPAAISAQQTDSEEDEQPCICSCAACDDGECAQCEMGNCQDRSCAKHDCRIQSQAAATKPPIHPLVALARRRRELELL